MYSCVDLPSLRQHAVLGKKALGSKIIMQEEYRLWYWDDLTIVFYGYVLEDFAHVSRRL